MRHRLAAAGWLQVAAAPSGERRRALAALVSGTGGGRPRLPFANWAELLGGMPHVGTGQTRSMARHRCVIARVYIAAVVLLRVEFV